MCNVIAFPIDGIIWRKIEAELKAEEDRNRNPGSARINRLFRAQVREKIHHDMKHIPLSVVDAEMKRLEPRINEAIAEANARLYEDVFRRRARECIARTYGR